MTAKQKAIVITQLVTLRDMAMENVLAHETEADRYRKQHRILEEQISKIATEPDVNSDEEK